MTKPQATSPRSTVRAHPERAGYDPAEIRAILDAGFLCHVGFIDDGIPIVIPTTYAPFEDGLVLHGAIHGRMVRRIASGETTTIAVTHLDGLVLARSAIFHSMNYRSVVLFGRGALLTDPARKAAALDALMDHVAPGRRPSVRPPTDKELGVTGVVFFKIEEASAKVRTGPPKDPESERESPAWAGVIPLTLAAGKPVADPWTTVEMPRHVAEWPLREGE